MNKIRKNLSNSIFKTISFMALLLGIVFLGSSFALAAFGEDVEKPRPVFAQDGAVITAKLIPRGKSTSVLLRFEADGGELTNVKALDFTSAKRPEVDNKDFRSDLFTITIANIAVGGEIKISVRSDFFSSSTRFFLFNEGATPAWTDAQAQHKSHSGRVRELTMTVKDGGPYDVDGAADGKILLNGGPHDSFWGYALGTLYIRFFGVFLVLGVLMVGMIVCGKFFEAADKRKAALTAASSSKQPQMQAPAIQAPIAFIAEPDMDPEMVAAIALALHLEMSGSVIEGESATESNQSAWNLYGRQKIMSDRLQVFKRHSHS